MMFLNSFDSSKVYNRSGLCVCIYWFAVVVAFVAYTVLACFAAVAAVFRNLHKF